MKSTFEENEADCNSSNSDVHTRSESSLSHKNALLKDIEGEGNNPYPMRYIYEHDKLDVFQLQNMLHGLGVLIPTYEIVSLYHQLNKHYKTGQNNDGSCFSFTELSRYVKESVGDGKQLTFRLLKVMVKDANLWIKSLFIIAGLLLMINACGGENIPPNVRRNFHMAVSTCYYINSGKYVFLYFIHEWIAQTNSSKSIFRFKQALQKKAALRNRQCVVEQRYNFSRGCEDWEKLLAHIVNEIYSQIPSKVLAKRDVDLLLLRELGQSYKPRVLDDIMSVIDKRKAGVLTVTEFHHFLASKNPRTSKQKHLFRRICSVVWVTMVDPDWINTLYFFLGSILAFTNNVAITFGKELSFFLGSVEPGLIVNLLFIIGCNGFIRSQYEISKNEFHTKERAKDILISHFRYSCYYEHKSVVMGEKNSETSKVINKMIFVRLLEECNVNLPDAQLDELFHDINIEGNGMLSKDETESYQKRDERNKELTILYKFSKSFNFWGNWTWLLGSYAFILSTYPTNQTAGRVGYLIGSIGYLVGGICLCGIIVEKMVVSLKYRVKLNNALQDIIGVDHNKLQTSPSDLAT